MNLQEYLDERIVLTTKNEVCYAGIPSRVVEFDGALGLMIVIDQRSGFSVWCPEDFIKEVLVIPIGTETTTGC